MIEKFYINKRASEFAYWETEITNEQPDDEKEFSLCLVKHSDYEALLRQLEQLKEVINPKQVNTSIREPEPREPDFETFRNQRINSPQGQDVQEHFGYKKEEP